MPRKSTSELNKCLDKIVIYLAKGYSNRAIAACLKVDRGAYKSYFLSDKYLARSGENVKDRLTISKKYSDRVCKDVLDNKLTYEQVRKKWGSKGLEALYTRWSLLRIQRDKDLMKKVVSLRLQKIPFDKIGRKLGICSWSANTFYKKSGKGPNFHVRQLQADKTCKQILTLHKRGLTIKQIAEKIHYTPSYVSYVLVRHGIFTKKPALSKEDMLKIYALRQAKVTWPEIGYIFGRPSSTIACNYRNHREEVSTWVKEQNLIHK